MKLNYFLKLSFAVFTTVFVMVLVNGFSFKNTDGDGDKPAEEVYKNIKVLKGMPAKDLHTVMNFMRASLNVKCSYCHLHNDKDNTWSWDSDSLENKNTAREMIEMVKGINNQYFEGNMGVTCFTCHRGSQNPAKVPPLPQAVPEVKKIEHPDELPEASAVFDNYLKALGVSKPEDIKSKYMKGTSALWDGKSFPVEIYLQAPDKFLSILTAPDGSKIYRGYDGKKGWTQNGSEINEVEWWDIDVLRKWADFYKDIDFKSIYTQSKVTGTDTADGITCYVIRGTVDDNRFDRLLFDMNSGLLIRKTTYTKSILGYITERTEYGNYKQVDGLKAAFSMRLSSLDPWGETIREFEEVKYNIAMDNINFSMPSK